MCRRVVSTLLSILSVLVITLSNTCFSFAQTDVPETNTPGTVGLYQDQTYGYTLIQPQGWYLVPSSPLEEGSVTQFYSYDPAQADPAGWFTDDDLKSEIVVEANPEHLTLVDWLRAKDARRRAAGFENNVLTENMTQVDALAAVERIYQDERVTYRVVYLDGGDRVYELSAIPATSRLMDQFNAMLASFRALAQPQGIPWADQIDTASLLAPAPDDSMPSLYFPFPNSWRISCGYHDDPSCAHPDDNLNRHALDWSDGYVDNRSIYAAHSGKVTGRYWDSLGGNVLVIDADGVAGGYTTRYAHLKSYKVSLNQWVSQGQEIARADCTGTCYGSHLHFSLLHDGASVPPEPMHGKSGFRKDQWHIGYVVCDDYDSCFTKYYSGNWNQVSKGYRDHAWWTWTTSDPNRSTNSARWRVNIPTTGNYQVQVAFPYAVTGYPDTTCARYQVYHRYGSNTVTVNQTQNYYPAWVSLGTFSFAQGTGTGSVILRDLACDNVKTIWFDAIRWVRIP